MYYIIVTESGRTDLHIEIIDTILKVIEKIDREDQPGRREKVKAFTISGSQERQKVKVKRETVKGFTI